MDEYNYRIRLKQGYDGDFLIIGGPLDEPENHRNLFAAIGLIALNWGRLEQHVDTLLIQVNATEHSEELYDPDHPVSFGRKIKLLKTWFNQHPALVNFTADVRDLTSKLKVISAERNLYLHSILERWDEEAKQAHFKCLQYEGNDDFAIKTFTVTLESLLSFGKLVNTSNKMLSLITRQIFTEQAHSALKQPRKP